MRSRKNWLLGAAALIATPLMGLPAWGSACTIGSVASYMAPSFSCNVGPVTFSNIVVNTIVTGSGSVTLGNFSPFNFGDEFGLSLNYIADTGTTPNSRTDVAWTYNVSGDLLSDVFLSLAGTTTGTGTITVSEVLSNGTEIHLNGAGSETKFFTPVGTLGVIKDQADFAGTAGSSSTSILQNGFSVTAVPLPLAGAGLPGLILASGGLIALARRRRKSAVFA